MATSARKKQGIVAFAAGVVAAPLVGIAAVALTAGLGLIWYAKSGAPAPDEDVAFGFAEPEEIRATEADQDRKRARKRAKPQPKKSTSSSRSSSRSGQASKSSSSGSDPSRSSSSGQGSAGSGSDPAPSSSGSTPAMPGSPEMTPDPADPPMDGEVVDGSDFGEDPFAPPEVAADGADDEPVRTSAEDGPGPHEFPEEDGPSWIPDTFRSVVNQGVAMLTGEAPEPEAAPSMPDAAPDQPVARTRPPEASGTDEAAPSEAGGPSAAPEERVDEPSPSTASVTPDDEPAPAVAAAPDEEISPAEAEGTTDEPAVAEARPDDAPSITPTGTGEPDAAVVPEASAIPTAEVEAPDVPFGPPPEPTPAPVEATGNSSTFDNLVSGGLDMVTGRGAPVVAQAPKKARTKTQMEEDVENYVDPSVGAGPALDFEDDDYTIDVEDHDVAASFGTGESVEDITAPIELEDLIIPVKIKTASPGVAVQVDGRDLGSSPARSDLSDADHTVVVGTGDDATTFVIAPMANPDVWCFDTKNDGGYRQVPCD